MAGIWPTATGPLRPACGFCRLRARKPAQLAATYAAVVTVLAALPIPMRLPERQADDPVWALRALSRAWDLADWEPVEKHAVGRIRDTITAWTTAYELAAAVDKAGPAAWRLRGLEAELRRVRIMARAVERYLSGRAGTGLE